MKVRIGTRGSDLALWQARHVAGLLRGLGVESELVVLQTRGDKIDDVPLTTVEGKAFFTAEIERALLERDVDVAVHSHKDLPVDGTPGLTIVAIPARGPRGERLLVAPAAHDPEGAFLPLAHGARVGTSSPRRKEQLAALRPDLALLDLRGNVPTRVRRLREGRYDAILLATAGLERLALATDGWVAVDLALELLVPAPAQGALAIQVRADDRELVELCRALDDRETARAVAAERTLLARAGGGCSLPLAASIAPDPGATDGSGWLAHGFLGAGHPAGATHGRWASARGDDPERAAEALFAQLASGEPTHTGPLAGLRIALTGSAGDGSVLGARLAALGADVVHERVIELEPIAGVDLAGALAGLRPGDAVAITSRQAARRLAGHALPAGVALAAVGRASARALEEAGHRATWVGTGGASELAARIELSPGARVLWPCAEEARPELEEALVPRGIEVRRLPVYRTLPCDGAALDELAPVRVYMSPSAVEAAVGWERAHRTDRVLRFALGHATAVALGEAGLAACAQSHRDAGRARGCCDAPIADELVRELARLVPTVEVVS
jgi:hydroxymethylbilane synthase